MCVVEKKQNETKGENKRTYFDSHKPTQKEIEELFTTDDYPLKEKKPHTKI